jgi:DNA-binding beta-propeller fold protein YncE
MKWIKDAKEGIVVAGGNAQGNSLTQLSNPHGVIVDQLGQIYVADFGNNRVMRWCSGAKEGTIVVGGNGEGQQSNQFIDPSGLSFDRQGNLYVADFWNHRIQKFEVE